MWGFEGAPTQAGLTILQATNLVLPAAAGGWAALTQRVLHECWFLSWDFLRTIAYKTEPPDRKVPPEEWAAHIYGSEGRPLFAQALKKLKRHRLRGMAGRNAGILRETDVRARPTNQSRF